MTVSQDLFGFFFFDCKRLFCGLLWPFFLVAKDKFISLTTFPMWFLMFEIRSEVTDYIMTCLYVA